MIEGGGNVTISPLSILVWMIKTKLEPHQAVGITVEIKVADGTGKAPNRRRPHF